MEIIRVENNPRSKWLARSLSGQCESQTETFKKKQQRFQSFPIQVSLFDEEKQINFIFAVFLYHFVRYFVLYLLL